MMPQQKFSEPVTPALMRSTLLTTLNFNPKARSTKNSIQNLSKNAY